jgi:2'-5' RNA ligase
MNQAQPPALETARLFLALLPGAGVQAALAIHQAQWRWNESAMRYAAPDWHLTLHFIGAVARPRLDELRAGLDLPLRPFNLRLGQAALWPQGLAVLCPAAVPAGLAQLHADLGQAVQRLGLKTDARPYRPHITLARHAAPAQPPSLPAGIDWPVEGYALMASTGQAASRYRVLQHYGSLV